MNKIEQLTEQLKDLYNKHLPNSFVNICDRAAIYNGQLFLECYLGNKKSFDEYGNDRMKHTYTISKSTKNDDFLIVTCKSIFLYVKPTKENMVYDTIRMQFRKKNNTPEKILVAMDNHFKKLKIFVCENKHLMYEADLKPLEAENIFE